MPSSRNHSKLSTTLKNVQLHLDALDREQTLCQTDPHGNSQENLSQVKGPPPVQTPRSILPLTDVLRKGEEKTPLEIDVDSEHEAKMLPS